MKKTFFLFVAIAFSISMTAQVFFGKLGNDVLVENAVKDAVVIMKSYYQLKDNEDGKMYGRNSNNYFGTAYTIGYSLPFGYVTTSTIMTPWNSDENYNKYKYNKRYSPVLLDSVWVKSALSSDKMKAKAFAKGKLHTDTCFCTLPTGDLRDSLFLMPADLKGELKGWILWLMMPASADKIDDTTQLTITSVYETIELTDTSLVTVKAPMRQERIVGGIFVVPIVTHVGKVEFLMRGFMVKEEGVWKLNPYNRSWESFTVEEKSKEEDKITQPESDFDELSPIEQSHKKDRKKNKKQK